MRVRFVGIFIILLFTLSVCELISRYFVSRDFSTPFWHPSQIIYTFYPELLTLPAKLEKGKINILVLGGSAITDSLCHTSQNLKREFNKEGLQVSVFNLSRFAHNTLDSRIKFKHCKDMGFDYVFVYNGINDTRTNNCPDNVFRPDYSHILFYSQADAFERHPEISYFTLPFVLDYYWDGLKIKRGWKKIISPEYVVINWKVVGDEITTRSEANIKAIKDFVRQNQDKVIGSDLMEVDSAWWAEGSNIKSAGSFRHNLEYVYYHKPQKTRLILADYAWYQAPGYSLNKFLYQKLDYGEQRWPTELYGSPENVVKGLRAHDHIIDSLAHEHSDIIYFDFNDSIPHSGKYFNDICHLADSGQILLSHILSNQIIKQIKNKK